METTIRCDEVKIISEGEKVKLIIIGIDEEDIQETVAEIERKKWINWEHAFTGIHDGEY